MKEKFIRGTIARLGPKGDETGGPDTKREAGKEVLGAVDAYRRNDREALERHLRAAGTYGALKLLDRRAANDGPRDGTTGTADDGSVLGLGSGSGSDTDAETDTDADAGTSADSGSGLLTLPRVALVLAVAAAGYAALRWRDSLTAAVPGDDLLDEGPGGVNKTGDPHLEVGEEGVKTEDDEDGSENGTASTDGSQSGTGSEDESQGDDSGEAESLDDEVETIGDPSEEDTEPGTVAAEAEVVEEAAEDEGTEADSDADADADADTDADGTDEASAE